MTFGERLKELRQDKGLTLREMAEHFNRGRTTFSNYENDYRKPDMDLIDELADFFNVSVDYLLCRTDQRQDPNTKIKSAISNDPELVEFWGELEEREDLQLLFKQTRDLSPETIQRVIKIIKIFEEEERERHGG
ncbi:transcriptional regulator with XRE-family HTH domain [Orenia metallireducens]|jgi:transcriptional regulator with XRE-family HTH domain|uniref:Transcriptional regulator, contains XRE-family HTH domain n=1 Tax=Orenia metallireducens TaxID=1413210 RepID=A0A285IC09_9FIRM|nr:helix-turn-helix transcriptional regulator [Orenia metallireducens]PRX21698.1 transcriptional regulator with XRE-family HTH domain [Orenia metallireducens]SNY44481.1 Transcriptional regulator, contains XRE-family HTH domain [Orenia metallireducens]